MRCLNIRRSHFALSLFFFHFLKMRCLFFFFKHLVFSQREKVLPCMYSRKDFFTSFPCYHFFIRANGPLVFKKNYSHSSINNYYFPTYFYRRGIRELSSRPICFPHQIFIFFPATGSQYIFIVRG